MKSDDIIMKTGIVHILDSSVGVPVLSDCPIDLSGDLSDFLKAHIEKLTESDDVKLCRFGNDSPVKQLLEQCTPETFVETSKQLALISIFLRPTLQWWSSPPEEVIIWPF